MRAILLKRKSMSLVQKSSKLHNTRFNDFQSFRIYCILKVSVQKKIIVHFKLRVSRQMLNLTSQFLFTHSTNGTQYIDTTYSKHFINQNKRAMDFNFVPPVVFNFRQELMNYERKRNRNSYLYYVIYEGPQLCSLLGEIRGLKRSQKTICS